MPDTLNASPDELRELARTIRKDVIIQTNTSKSGHPGGPFSAADYTAALLNFLRLRPEDPYWEDRDRYVLSNGHCSALIYSMLSRRGYFSPSYLTTFRTTPSRLQGHPNHVKLPGVEIGAGSLGQGLSVAHGMALGAKLDGKDNVRVVCNCGDGELQEGQIWEAFMHAGHRKSDNLIVGIDYNDAQIDGRVVDVKRIDPLDDKLAACHFHVKWCDGHDMQECLDAWQWAWDNHGSGKPSAIIFKSIMMQDAGEKYEDIPGWHGKPPNDEQALEILRNLGYDYASMDEARAEYGEPKYDGVLPPKQYAPWAYAVHAETCEITLGGK